MAKKRPKPANPEPAPNPKSRAKQLALIAVLLIAATAIAYWHSPECGFIKCFDDESYVTNNFHLTQGFAHGIAWAFGSEYRAANWHPLTWISLLVDYQLYGLDPKGFHLTNVLIHIANTLLLFFVLSRMTGAVWKSGFVAALFAVHPLHVESVAWVAERKDVLSTFFWLVTIYAYVLYAKKPRARTYIAVVLAYGLGLLAKPMLVTLPLVLLLLDYWPLNRMNLRWKLVWEKLPLVAMTIASCVITVIAQRAGGALAGLRQVPVESRIGNAAISYVAYIWKMLWPAKLAAFYPHPRMEQPVGEAIGAALVLIVITILALRAAKRRPYLAMGWLWFVITLVPVIGLVQVGSQAMADRYSYITLTGLFIIIAWGVPELLHGVAWRKLVPYAAAALIVVLTLATQAQVNYWRDPITLFKHAIEVTTGNSSAYERVGRALEDDGELPEALTYLTRAVEIEPQYCNALMALGRIQIKLAKNPDGTIDTGKVNEGMSHLHLALRLGLDTAEEHQNLAFGYYSLKQYDLATNECLAAQRLDPEYAPSEYTLGNIRFNQRKIDQAISLWQSAVKHDPTFAEPHHNLAFAYCLKREYRTAWREIHLFQQLGEQPDPKLIALLSAQMPEPK